MQAVSLYGLDVYKFSINLLFSQDTFSDASLNSLLSMDQFSPYSTFDIAFVNGGSITGSITSAVATSDVPVPASAWLFGSALMTAAGIKRKKSLAA